MKKETKIKVIKLLIFILVLAIIIGTFLYLLPVLKNLNTTEGKLAFKEKVNNSKVQGFLILFGLEIAQIILAILPGEPIELLAGVCFGTLWGTVFIMVSIFISTLLIYFLVKKYGRKFIYNFISKDKINKIENSKLFKDERKIEIVMILLFLIPGTPKDILVYIGGLLPVKSYRFILIATLLRFPSVISSTIAGDNLLDGKLMISVMAYLVTFVITIIIIIIVNKCDKNKITKQVIESVKEKEF